MIQQLFQNMTIENESLKIAQQANQISKFAIVFSILGLVLSFYFNWIKIHREAILAYKIEYISREFPKASGLFKDALDQNNLFFEGGVHAMRDYGYIDSFVDEQEIELIRTIDRKLAESMMVVYNELNPKILEMNELYDDIRQQTRKAWADILMNEDHRGFDEKTLALHLFDECKKGLFTGDYDRVLSVFHDVMGKYIVDYYSNPYSGDTVRELRNSLPYVFETYETLLLEIKKLNQDNIVEIILPKMKKLIAKPF